MGSQVFVLGAGFSKAVSCTMPLMPDLGDAVRQKLAAHLLPSAADAFGNDFEAWLSYLATDQPWLSPAENLRNRAMFLDVSGAVEAAINEAQQEATKGRMPPNELSWLVQHWHSTQATVVTFNYDLLVEDAYLHWRYQKLGGIEDLYRLPLTPVLARSGESLLGGEPQHAFDLLKLHGSVNWYYSGLGDAGDTIYLGFDPVLWSRPETASSIQQDEVVYGRPRHRDYLIDKVAMIVLPASAKSNYYSNLSLRTQWRAAADALDRADELVIIGYSLPAADELVRGLLRTATSRLQRAVVVDKRGHDVVKRLRGLLGEDVVVDESFAEAEAPLDLYVKNNQ